MNTYNLAQVNFMNITNQLKRFLTLAIFTSILVLAFNIDVCKASNVSINFSVIEPVQTESIAWIPEHVYRGYWVPGQYVRYANYQPASGVMLVANNYYRYPHHHAHRHYYYY